MYGLLYSWRFSRYSAPIHWLDHGHMTSNNETVSRQMPWAGHIAKTMTSNGKQFTVTREMLTAVARDRWNLSAVFKFCVCFVCFVLLDFVSGNIEILWEQNSLFPSGPVIKCLIVIVTMHQCLFYPVLIHCITGWLYKNQHACKTSAHAQGLYFQIGGCQCELHNKNVCFWAKIKLY